MERNKGITLVALVVTVIVLLILAGTSISLITGEDGLFAKANHAATLYNQKAKEEAELLNQLLAGNYIPSAPQQNLDPIPELTTTDLSISLDPDTNINPSTRGSGVMVTLTENVESGYQLQYSLNGDDNFINYTAPFEVTEYGTVIIARLYDTATEREGDSTATYTVTNIDTLVPNIFTFTQGEIGETTIAITSTGATDQTSADSASSNTANLKYKYAAKTSNTPPTWNGIIAEETTSKTFTGLTAGTTYYIYAAVVDEAGNLTESSTNGLEIVTDTPGTNLRLADGSFDTKDLVNSPDVSKLNTSNFSYLTWVDANGNNSNIASTPYEVSGSSTVPTTWHDYDTGQWANIKTFNGSVEAYWVWIPRFAYQIPASGGTGNEDIINVKFINGNGTTLADGTGNAVYATQVASSGLTKDVDAKYKKGGSEAKWIVHPAFTFGDNATLNNSANKQLSGIWVAKFCASSSSPTATNGGGDVTNLKVKSVPGVLSWRKITLKNIWTNVQAMTASGGAVVAKSGVTTSANVATIPTSFIDTHPAKMMEWSAVSILSQSAYGVYNQKSSTGYSSGTNKATTYEGTTGNGDLQVWNNSRSNYTGYAASTKNGHSESQDANYAYNTANGIKASTTGTVYGVYDMAGCSWVYVMGIYNGIASINSSYRPSLTASRYRYYDNYTNTSAATAGRIGDLTNETSNGSNITNNWNSDSALFVSSGSPVFKRAGSCGGTTNAGVFNYLYSGGDADSNNSFRPVLVAV